MLDSSSTETVSIENYEIHISRSNFTHIHIYLCHIYLCRVSFLTTLDIYIYIRIILRAVKGDAR